MEENAYQLLGLEQGPEATEAEIKKAYRKLALVKHPDKNPDNPNAADEFQQLQRAYDLLCDKEARAALDALLKAKAARVERVKGHDDKRRKMMADLERREKGWESARTQEETARAKLQAEMERLRRTAAERAAKRAAEQQAATQAAKAAQQQQQQQQQQQAAPAVVAAAPGELSEEMKERLQRTLKVSWSRKDGEYTAVQLRGLFSQHGPVEDVVLREGKKRKGSALVVMAHAAGAAAAAGAVNGPLANPLLVVPFNKAAGAALGSGAAWEEDGDEQPALAAAGAPTNGRTAPPAPAFAAGAALAANRGTGLVSGGARPSAPFFAGGARAGGGGSGGLFPGGSSGGSLFPGGSTSVGGPPSRPLFAAAAAGSTQPPAGSVQQQQRRQNHPAAPASSAASSFPAGGTSFSSFQSFPGTALGSTAAGVHALGAGGLEDATLARMRQVAERRRLVEEMERAEDG